MDALPINLEYKGKDPSILYITRLQNIANNFKLTMELAHPAGKTIFVTDILNSQYGF
jgi:hypothetical protein